MFGRLTCTTIAALVCMLSFGHANAGTLGHVVEKGELRIGIKTDAPPLSFLGTHGENKGFDVEVTRMLVKELFGTACTARFVPTTPGDETALLDAGQVDMVIGTAAATKSTEDAYRSIPYLVSGHLVLQKSNDHLISYRDLKGKRVGVVGGSLSDRLVTGLDATPVRFPTIMEAVGALRKGRVEAVVGKEEVLFEAEKKQPALTIADWKPFAIEHCCFAVKRGDDEWLERVNQGLRRIEKKREYFALLDKWFGLPRALLYERMLRS